MQIRPHCPLYRSLFSLGTIVFTFCWMFWDRAWVERCCCRVFGRGLDQGEALDPGRGDPVATAATADVVTAFRAGLAVRESMTAKVLSRLLVLLMPGFLALRHGRRYGCCAGSRQCNDELKCRVFTHGDNNAVVVFLLIYKREKRSRRCYDGS